MSGGIPSNCETKGEFLLSSLRLFELTCICEHSQDMYILTLNFIVVSFNETEIIFIILDSNHKGILDFKKLLKGIT